MALLLEAELGSPWFEDIFAVVGRDVEGWLRHYLVGADVLTVLLVRTRRGVRGARRRAGDAGRDVYATMCGWQA